MEQNWIEIDDQWLRSYNVKRIFIASHNSPLQFAEEGQFLNNALLANVEHVVRICTTSANVRPDQQTYYPRTHWALEVMLEQPEYKKLGWTSLRANNFLTYQLATAAEFVKQFRKSGNKQPGPLRLMLDEKAPNGTIHSADVGIFAGHILADDEIARHSHKKYVLNDPEDLTGEMVVALVERDIGTKVEDVEFRSLDSIRSLIKTSEFSKNVMSSLCHAPDTTWSGEANVSTTSPEVNSIYKPSTTAEQVFQEMLKE